MIDILVYLFENYADFSTHPEADSLIRKLSAVGFDELEIGAALEWLAPLRQSEADVRSTGFRVFTDQERHSLAEGCLDFLIFLERSGVVSPLARELILDRALNLSDAPVSFERFKVIVLMVLWSRDAAALDPLIVEELLTSASDAGTLDCH